MPTIVDLQAGEHGCIIRVSELAIRPLSLATRLWRAFFVGCVLFGAVFVFLTFADSGQSGTGTTAIAATLAYSFVAALTGALGAVLFRRRPLCVPEVLHALYSRANLIPLPKRSIVVDQAQRQLIIHAVSGTFPMCIPFDQIKDVRLAPGVKRRFWQGYRIEPVASMFGEVVFTVVRTEAKAITGRAVVLLLHDGREALLAEEVSLLQPSSVRLLHLLEGCLAK